MQAGGFERIGFNRRELKQALRKGGAMVQRESRRLIAWRAVSRPGEFPGYASGLMSRSIKVKVGSGGGYVRIMPYKIPGMKQFYPAFLEHGTSRGLKPRANFMEAAFESERGQIQAVITRSLERAIQTCTGEGR